MEEPVKKKRKSVSKDSGAKFNDIGNEPKYKNNSVELLSIKVSFFFFLL